MNDRPVRAMLLDLLKDEFAHLDGTAPPTHVLVGDCREVLDYAVLDDAFRALRAGAELVALQRGRFRTGKFADQHAEGITGLADATIDSVAVLPAFLDGGLP